MLDSETKRRIDTARDILVGKVPDPKSQVEQITIALIYKFMDDMDAHAEEFGGKRKFFAKDFARFGWAKLMRSGLGGHETLNLYAEAIQRMPENPGIPALFRDIFKNAYLPYRDPETLRAFLKIIDEFEYDHSERLGDAFEYLLSVLGSQGDAGQFRTPRHVIDFIVSVVDPKKNETVLDPACGTAGFMISAYKHILRANSSPSGRGQGEGAPGSGNGEAALHVSKIPPAKGDKLTPDERKKLADNFRGYDISPDMVRLSLVNMYLHGFTDPHIYEYDTLTSQDRWNEMADVILANPPFMSPKGGIKPHNRFSVQSKRSEVLFVDYMAEHLTPGGRAGIIVPEGIIFQSQTAYKALRKMLVEQYLVAVVSLPAGVFNPYSGVKTSILILDKSLAKQSDTVGFFKVENDGFNLGAQRRPIDKNNLPQVLAEIEEYLRRLRAKESVAAEDFTPTRGLIVAKEKIAANGDYNLSAERYRDASARASAFPLRPFEEVCTLEYGESLPKEKRKDGPYPVVGSNGITGYHDAFIVEGPAIVVGRKGSAGEVVWIEQDCFPIDTTYYVKQTNRAESDLRFLYRILKSLNLPELRGGAGIPGLNRSDVYSKFEIPLPPLEVQKEIVAEIEAYQKVIDGARAVLDHYRPHIPINLEWPMVELKKLCTLITDGDWIETKDQAKSGIRLIQTGNVGMGQYLDKSKNARFIDEPTFARLKCTEVFEGDVLVSRLPDPVGRACQVPRLDRRAIAAVDCSIIRFNPKLFLPEFFISYTCSAAYYARLERYLTGSSRERISRGNLETVEIPLPPLAEQEKIVAEIEAEQRLVEGNRQLIERMEQKIAATLARIWGGSTELATETLAETVAVKPVARDLFGEEDRVEQYAKHGCLVACRIISKVRKVGKTWLEKGLHLIEAHCDLSMGRHPIRMAHGPADLKQHDRIMNWAKDHDAFIVQEKGKNQRADYTRGNHFDAMLKDAEVELGDRKKAVDDLINKLSSMSKEQMEWLATAYASWNDFLIDKVKPTDDQIIKDIRTNWHISKQKVKDADWRWALKWLRENKVIPTGRGRRVEAAA